MMRFFLSAMTVAVVASTTLAVKAGEDLENGISVSADDWPWWRGPQRNGVASANQKPPLAWSDSKNVLWKTPIPGRGHGSVTVVGDRVYLQTADDKKQTQSVLCLDRSRGKVVWTTDVHTGGVDQKGNGKASRASSTVACDGKRLYVNFLNSNAVFTTALDLHGKKIWQTKITDYVTHQGYGASPALYRSLVIVTGDNKGGGAVAGLHRETGKIVWKNSRPATANYASPMILRVSGRDQLLLTGCNLVSSFEPLTGKKIWEIKGSTTECVTSTVTDGNVMITSGGYPRNHVAAIKGDGSGEVVWEKKVRVYVPSMFVRSGFLYAVTDAGIAICWNCKTGEEKWRKRLGGKFTASPVLVGDRIFATSEKGRTFIFRADPKGFKMIGTNSLGDEVFATPTYCGSRVYMRVAVQSDGQRREFLYCLGRSDTTRGN